LRVSIAIVHSAFAAITATGSIFVAGQAWVNLQWELGFYGAPSLLTQGMLGAGGLQVALAATQLAAAWAWAAGWRAAGVALIASTVVLAVSWPAPLSWALGLASGMVLLDLLESPVADGEDDGDERGEGDDAPRRGPPT
jgi:hypothetical protein